MTIGTNATVKLVTSTISNIQSIRSNVSYIVIGDVMYHEVVGMFNVLVILVQAQQSLAGNVAPRAGHQVQRKERNEMRRYSYVVLANYI